MTIEAEKMTEILHIVVKGFRVVIPYFLLQF